VNQPQSSPRSVEPGLNPVALPFHSTRTTSTLCLDNLQTVFLQTARAVIHHPRDPHVSLEVRLILDGGSQKSYISERARGLLNLEATGEQSLSIATFGSNKGTTRVCPVVNVGLCLRGYLSMSLSVYVMPAICEPLARQPVSACVRQYPPPPPGVELVDSSSTGSSTPVHMLIGSDYYWQLVTGSICRVASGSIAIHTKLSWVLSGPSLVPMQAPPQLLSHTVQKTGREPGQFDHVHDDVLCVVLCMVLVIELSPTHTVVERISVLETALLTFTVLDAAQDDRKEA